MCYEQYYSFQSQLFINCFTYFFFMLRIFAAIFSLFLQLSSNLLALSKLNPNSMVVSMFIFSQKISSFLLHTPGTLSTRQSFEVRVSVALLLISFIHSAARLMHKYQAHACTDVTGFGLLGHARNLVQVQQEEVNFVIHNLPVIAKMSSVVKQLGGMFGLHEGRSAETSGEFLKLFNFQKG